MQHAALAAVLLLGAWLCTSKVLMADDKFGSHLVEVNIGDKGYLIPRNYLLNIRYDSDTNEDAVAFMRALWPGLEPLTEDNQDSWKKIDPQRQVIFRIRDHGHEGYRGLQGAIRANFVPESPISIEYDLVQYKRGRHQFFVPQDKNYVTPSGQPLVLDCTIFAAALKSADRMGRSLCIVQYKLEDNSYLYYRLFLANISNWREVDTSIRALLETFRKD